MKLYFTIILSLITITLFSQEELIESYPNQFAFQEFIKDNQSANKYKQPNNLAIQLDSLVTSRIDSNTGIWSIGIIDRYEYFHNGDLKFREFLWLPYQRSLSYFTHGNRMLQRTTEPLDPSQPITTTKTNMIYDSNNLLIIDSIYHKNSSGWYIHGINKYTYDSNGIKLTKTSFQKTGSNFEYTYKREYEYNQNNQLNKETGYSWNAPTWDYRYIIEYEYDQNLNQSVYKLTNYNNNQWDSLRMEKFTYDANNNIFEKLRYHQITNVWELNGKYTYYHDQSYPGSDIWYPYFSDFNSKLLSTAYNPYYGGIWKPTLDSTIYYYSSAPVSVNEISVESFKIYPNPVKGNLVTELKISGSKELTIIDLTGKVVLSRTFTSNRLTVNVGSLRDGVYILQISSKEGVFSKMMVKQ